MEGSITALITGVTGQDGSYLAEFLLAKGYIVHGMVRRASDGNTKRIDHLINHPKHLPFYIHFGDMTCSNSLVKLLLQIKPDEIYNLAAQSHVRVSFDLPEYTANCTGIGALRLLEAIRTCHMDKQVKFYQASSSELYGKISNFQTKQNEDTPFNPSSPYAIAKIFAYYTTINYRLSYGIFACNGILFNHESPRRGNLDAKRDWGHAKEYVEAMWLMMQLDTPYDLVIATGETYSVRYFVEKAFEYVNMPISWMGSGLDEVGVLEDGNIVVRIDPKFFRPTEVSFLCGDASKAKFLLDWSPSITVANLIAEMMEQDLKNEQE